MRRQRRGLIWAVLALAAVCVASSSSAASYRETLDKAGAHLRAGHPDEALELLRELQVDHPSDPVLGYAIASAFYRKAEGLVEAQQPEVAASAFGEAQQAFAALESSERADVAEMAGFGKANCVAQAAKLAAAPENYQKAVAAMRGAVAAYETFLKKHPGHAGAQQNLDHVRYLLKKLLQNPPPEQPQDQQQNQQQQPPPPPMVLVGVQHAQTELPDKNAVVLDETTVSLQEKGQAASIEAGSQP